MRNITNSIGNIMTKVKKNAVHYSIIMTAAKSVLMSALIAMVSVTSSFSFTFLFLDYQHGWLDWLLI